MAHIAHLSDNNRNEIRFMKSYTKYLDSVVEQILYKQIFNFFFGYILLC